MEVTLVKFPVVCPACAKEDLIQLPLMFVAKALAYGRSIRLSSRCHQRTWTASELEREQIRQYLDAAQRGHSP